MRSSSHAATAAILVLALALIELGSAPSAFAQTLPTASQSPASTVAATPQPEPSLTPVPAGTAAPAAETAPAPSAPPARGGLFHHRAPAVAGSPNPDASNAPQAQATPASPAYSTLDGMWEIQRQFPNRTAYSHLRLAQKGDALSGDWLLEGKNYPVTGTYDGHNIKLVATLPDGDATFAGYVLDGANMVGQLLPTAKSLGDSSAFTATHRGKSHIEFNTSPASQFMPGPTTPSSVGAPQ